MRLVQVERGLQLDFAEPALEAIVEFAVPQTFDTMFEAAAAAPPEEEPPRRRRAVDAVEADEEVKRQRALFHKLRSPCAKRVQVVARGVCD